MTMNPDIIETYEVCPCCGSGNFTCSQCQTDDLMFNKQAAPVAPTVKPTIALDHQIELAEARVRKTIRYIRGRLEDLELVIYHGHHERLDPTGEIGPLGPLGPRLDAAVAVLATLRTIKDGAQA